MIQNLITRFANQGVSVKNWMITVLLGFVLYELNNHSEPFWIFFILNNIVFGVFTVMGLYFHRLVKQYIALYNHVVEDKNYLNYMFTLNRQEFSEIGIKKVNFKDSLTIYNICFYGAFFLLINIFCIVAIYYKQS